MEELIEFRNHLLAVIVTLFLILVYQENKDNKDK